ncbi:ComEA family DNA-binding protein [Ferrimonas gelatinilytica]|uniref:Helix-hairpin-helix DNA-binding motif class 1 domain-containing protein n=1 Tax=Ferrimonas gelatinilytica TaxID=1255257 RepID=A0ABP9RTL3_9GAMM
MKKLLPICLALLCQPALAAEPVNNPAASPSTESVHAIEKVNINTADAETLAAALIGVGPKKAEAIVRYREQEGAFRTPEQLTEVKGIGAQTLAKNLSRIQL